MRLHRHPGTSLRKRAWITCILGARLGRETVVPYIYQTACIALAEIHSIDVVSKWR